MPPTRILLIDDHAMFRTGLGMLLHSTIENLQVENAGALDEVLHGKAEAPDILLLDIRLHGLNGIDGIALIKRKWPHVPIVMLSSDAAPETIRSAMAQGATAFVSKENTAENVLTVVKQVLAQTPVAVMTASAAREDGVPNAATDSRLTPRQCEVLDLLCQGLPNKAIGRKLGLTENTVRWHVQAVLAFLQVSNRSEAAFAARKRGLIG